MNSDNIALFDALGTKQPSEIAHALRAGTVLIPTGIAPEGDERFVVPVDDDGRRILLTFSCRATLAAWEEAGAGPGRQQVVLGLDLGRIARHQQVEKVYFDSRSPHVMSVDTADLQLALDSAGAEGTTAPGNPDLAAALPGENLQVIARALRSGTIIVPSHRTATGGSVTQFEHPDGRRALYAFSTHDLFGAWVEQAGDVGDHQVLGGAGLGLLARQTGVGGVILDPASPHMMVVETEDLAASLDAEHISSTPAKAAKAAEPSRPGFFSRRRKR